MSIVDLSREIGDKVSDVAHLTAEEAQAVIEGAIGDVELGAAKIGKSGLSSLVQGLGLPDGPKSISLENLDEFIQKILDKGKDLLGFDDSKFGDIDATAAGAKTKTVENDPKMDEFISTMRKAMVAQLEDRQAERTPVKNSGPSI